MKKLENMKYFSYRFSKYSQYTIESTFLYGFFSVSTLSQTVYFQILAPQHVTLGKLISLFVPHCPQLQY